MASVSVAAARVRSAGTEDIVTYHARPDPARHRALPVLWAPRLTLAWNTPGHMIVGAIAYDVLARDDPDTVARLVTLMHFHPQWELFQQRMQAVPEADRDRYLFMLAGRWPDDIRDNPEFN